MKKVFSILLSVLMLTTMLHFSVALHFCKGNLAASEVSLTGKLATCGMEGLEKEIPLAGFIFTNKCCEDVITFCGINNNFTPSFSFVPDYFQYSFQVFAIAATPVNYHAELITLDINASPPGVLLSTNVDLSDICVFRI